MRRNATKIRVNMFKMFLNLDDFSKCSSVSRIPRIPAFGSSAWPLPPKTRYKELGRDLEFLFYNCRYLYPQQYYSVLEFIKSWIIFWYQTHLRSHIHFMWWVVGVGQINFNNCGTFISLGDFSSSRCEISLSLGCCGMFMTSSQPRASKLGYKLDTG